MKKGKVAIKWGGMIKMGLQLDWLSLSGTAVIENNTTGRVREFHVDTNGFLIALKEGFNVEPKDVLNYFGWDELESFFSEREIEIKPDFWKVIGIGDEEKKQLNQISSKYREKGKGTYQVGEMG